MRRPGSDPRPFSWPDVETKIPPSQQPGFAQGFRGGEGLLARRCDWRCLFWLPSVRREAWTSVAMFVIFLALLPFGTKLGLQMTDLKVSGVDYRPLAGLALVVLLIALNILRIQLLAIGDYLSDGRLLRVTLITWVVLSGITLGF